MKWIPPIPYGALYSPPARQLGSALPLLGWCYDNVTTGGWLDLNLQEIAGELNTPYRTIKLWWQALRTSEFIADVQDRGRRGLRVRISGDWIDWRVMEARIIKNGAGNGPITEINEPEMGQDIAPESVNEPEMSQKWAGNGAENGPSNSMYKVLHADQESPPPVSANDKRNPDRGVVVMMYGKGFTSSSAINAIARLGIDCETISASVDNLRADGWKDNGRIIRRLQEHPPEPGKPYPRTRVLVPVTRPSIPDDILTPTQLAERVQKARNGANHDT